MTINQEKWPIWGAISLKWAFRFSVHPAPLLVERNTPAEFPAKRFVPVRAEERTPLFAGRPLLTSLQFVPLFVERKTPPAVPAKVSTDVTTGETVAFSSGAVGSFLQQQAEQEWKERK